MLYQAYQASTDMMLPVRALAGFALSAHAAMPHLNGHAVRNLTAAYELISRARLTHTRPDYGIRSVTVGNREVEVTEEVAHVTPFGTLLRFRKDVETAQPRVLIVAPLSGHFATLLSTMSISPTGTMRVTFRCRPAGSASTITSLI